MVRRGPAAKIQTTLSLKPNGWHAEQAPHPLFDIRPEIFVPSGASSKTPMDVLYSSLPMWILSSRVPDSGSAADRTVAMTLSRVPKRLMMVTSRETSFITYARLSSSLMTMPRGLLPVGIWSTLVASVGSDSTAGAPVDGFVAILTTMLLAALMT